MLQLFHSSFDRPVFKTGHVPVFGFSTDHFLKPVRYQTEAVLKKQQTIDLKIFSLYLWQSFINQSVTFFPKRLIKCTENERS